MKKVTIVIPTFNQIEYLPTCIDHCIFQTYKNLEIIIVDGGSTDETKEYLKNLDETIKRQTVNPVSHLDDNGNIIRNEERVYPEDVNIKTLIFNEDIGATRSYNEGFKLATGDYCTYIVGDDIPHPHMIEELVKSIEKEKVDFVYSDLLLVNDKGRIVRKMEMPDFTISECFAKWYHIGVSHLYKRELHDKVGLMDENYKCANDYDHYIRFAMTGAKFFHLPKILYSIRHHDEKRKTGQHTSERYEILMNESVVCANRIRDWLKK